jgi:TPR repeat protein
LGKFKLKEIKMRKNLWALLFLLTFDNNAVSDDIATLHKAAEQGNAQAQNNLGFMYYQGTGIAKDDTQVAMWVRKAAEQGDAEAQSNLGMAYANGIGIAKNETQAVGWFRKVAKQGFAMTQTYLGTMYLEGIGVSKDETQAMAWTRKAADQGFAMAQTNLGTMYLKDIGVSKCWRRLKIDHLEGFVPIEFLPGNSRILLSSTLLN